MGNGGLEVVIMDRLDIPTTNFYEPSGTQFITVNRVDNLVQLVYLDQSYLTSQLVQSELDLSQPYFLTAPYSQAMFLSLACLEKYPQRLYLAGLGGGRIPFVLHHYLPELSLECTEIDPTIVEVAKSYFGIVVGGNFQVVICDGRGYLEQCHSGDLYDVIMLDVVLGTGYSPYRLATVEFYELCQSRLRPDGVVAVSLFEVEPFFREKMQTLSACFRQVFICKLTNGNAVALATNHGSLSLDKIQARAKLLMQDLGLGFPLDTRSRELQLWVSPETGVTTIFRDSTPPESYFDLLPHFNTLFSQVQPHLPCPCGSGKMFQNCHGLEFV